jgi:uncharacterized protein (TIGR03545 family)
MSTGGSVRSGDDAPAPLTPSSQAPAVEPLTPQSQGGPPPPAKRVAVFRWRGIFALVFGFALAAILWIVFGKLWVRRTIQDTASQSLGTEVDVGGLSLDLVNARVELRAIAIADPFDVNRNLVEARVARVVLEPDALLQKKIVIRELTLDGVTAGTRRSTPARPMRAGFAPRAMKALQDFRKQFQVPLLSLTPIDTIKALVLDPTKLATVKRATELRDRGDSLRKVLTTGVQSIQLKETVDSARALVSRLNGQTPRSLGLTGTRNAINDTRRLTARVDSIRRQVDAAIATARSGVDSLIAATKAVDDARRADFQFARSLLKLPTVDAPNIGPALFGNVSVSAFDQAMYWMSLAREYAPPGLLPRETPGPKRVRRAGTTVHFVTPASYPNFLLLKGNVTVSLGESAGAARGEYRLTASDITSEPALVGRPMRFTFDRASKGSDVEAIAVNGLIDHAGKTPREVVELRAGGLKLPGFPLPATPLRADLGRGRSSLRLERNGEGIAGTWSVAAPSATWVIDPARAKSLNTMEQLVTRVIQSIRDVNLTAEVAGTMKSPRLSVRSNLDRAVADGIKSVVGGEVAKAEGLVRAQVDSAAEQAMAPVRAKVAELRAEVDARAKEATTRLDDAKRQLAAQLKTLGGGLLGLP